MNWIGLYSLVVREVKRTFRVVVQTLISPWISALLYIFIFGYVIGGRIDLIAGVSYIDFVLPGILMMNVISSSFGQSSSSMYFMRFTRSIEEILVAPLSYLEMLIGMVTATIVRAVLVGLGILVIAVLFSAASFANIPLFIFYVVSVSIVFSLLGILVGLWSKGFEQLNILGTFIITPLSFLGGIFYSINMLPETAQTLTRLNPFFYFIDGIRYSMLGIQESNQALGLVVIIALILVLGGLVLTLFRRGWRIRE